ncbi:MAG: (d)CMP kinase, partial [Elusimicrobiota bacterium]|nr:(d)CMP kinase [Elusimicrobiota bacterium]
MKTALYKGALAAVKAAARGHGQKPFIIAIDGRCAAGKTTFAKWLAARLKAPVLHIDDFYLPLALRPARAKAAAHM